MTYQQRVKLVTILIQAARSAVQLWDSLADQIAEISGVERELIMDEIFANADAFAVARNFCKREAQ
jgi:hypothetical protein